MAFGGTELAYEKLITNINPSLLENIQIVNRPTELEEGKRHVLWAQDMPGDMPFLANKKDREKFDAIVFVSSWQQTVFNLNMGISFAESTIIKNAIEPIDKCEKTKSGQIRLIYHPTPHRGLEILVPTFIELAKRYNNLHLDVFSNFDIYGWGTLNKNYETLYEQCRAHPQITYHGFQPNHVVREALRHAHIFSYPCIWRETSCMSAMEAMSAGCLVVAPDYGALPETLANFNVRYDWSENFNVHGQHFFDAMCESIETFWDDDVQKKLKLQKEYADMHYGWGTRKLQWEDFLGNLKPKKVVKGTINWM